MKALNKTLVSCLAHDALHLILMPAGAPGGPLWNGAPARPAPPSPMERRVVRGLRNLLTDRAGAMSHLGLSWFGCEPLLAGDVVVDILEHVRRLRFRHPGLYFESDLTTDGHRLDRVTFERLCTLGVRHFQVSLVDPRDPRDPLDTEQLAWSHLESLTDVGDDFSVRVVAQVDRGTQERIPDLIDRFADAFAGDPRFQLRMLRSRLEGYRVGVDVLTRLRSRAEERGIGRLDEQDDATVRHAAKANAFVLYADGRVDRCSPLSGHPSSRLGRLHESGRLEAASEDVIDWMRGPSSGEAYGMFRPLLPPDDDGDAR